MADTYFTPGTVLTSEWHNDVNVHTYKQTVNVKEVRFNAKGDGVTDDWAALQAAIDFVESQQGGEIILPPGNYKITQTLNIDGGYGVCLRGLGSDGIHDGGTGAGAATTITWAGSAGGTMINFSSTAGAGNSRKMGGGVIDIKLDCASLAGIGLLVNSVRNANFLRLYILAPTIAAVKTTTLGNTNLAESSDTQQCVFDRVSFRNIDNATTRAAHGFWLTSHNPSSSNANTSLNLFTQCGGQSWGGAGSGYGLYLEDGDNNTFHNFRVTRAGGTTVEGVRFVGNPNCDGNHFWNISVGGVNSITIKGTASGFPSNPKKNTFWVVDAGNGTQYPTMDANVYCGWNSDTLVTTRPLQSKTVIADSETQALTQNALVTNESLRVFNGSNAHIILDNGTHQWSVNINAVNGDLRINRLAGSGSVDIGSGAPVKIFGQAISTGAVDSGGTGFRVLRVPN